jgi:hypothetical protein
MTYIRRAEADRNHWGSINAAITYPRRAEADTSLVHPELVDEFLKL